MNTQSICIKNTGNFPYSHDSEWRRIKQIKRSRIFQYLNGCAFSTVINGLFFLWNEIKKKHVLGLQVWQITEHWVTDDRSNIDNNSLNDERKKNEGFWVFRCQTPLAGGKEAGTSVKIRQSAPEFKVKTSKDVRSLLQLSVIRERGAFTWPAEP